MKIIFMGTPDFAVGALESIADNGHEVVLVVTQEDKPKGRGGKMSYPPVKEAALKRGIEVFQPHKIKEDWAVEKLRQYEADVFVVAAYGQILSEEILNMPRLGCVNIHASLLPKYRGAAPIQWALVDGETHTGVTTMMMAKGLDTGDMLDKAVVEITSEDTGGSLHDKLMEAGARLILETLEKLENNTAVRTVQDDSLSCYAKMLDKKLGCIDFTQSAEFIERLVRGLNPWPSAYTFCDGKMMKIWKAQVVDKEYEGVCGQVVEITKTEIVVKTGKGSLAITELQPEGKKRMLTESYLCGASFDKGMIFGNNVE